MRVLKNKREIQNYEKLREIGLFCYLLFPIIYKHFTHFFCGNAAITV